MYVNDFNRSCIRTYLYRNNTFYLKFNSPMFVFITKKEHQVYLKQPYYPLLYYIWIRKTASQPRLFKGRPGKFTCVLLSNVDAASDK